MSLSTAINQLRTNGLKVSGVRAAPNLLPESLNIFPTVLVYPRSGRLELQSSGFGTGFHMIFVDFFMSRALLGPAVEDTQRAIEQFDKLLIADPTLGGAVSVVQIPIEYIAGRMEYNGAEHYGVQFQIQVKIIERSNT